MSKKDLREETKEVISWTKEYVEKSKMSGVVVGLSGGIDSALVAKICTDAIGKDRVKGLILPCFSTREDVEDAIMVAEWLGISYDVVSLDDTFSSLMKTMGPVIGEGNCLVAANMKSRLRMVSLYSYANLNKALVVGTTNKSEMTIGYYTKYGDGGVDFEPIQEFLKTEVWSMASFLGVPRKIIDRIPSAGLWEGQSDENEIGMSYSDLDNILNGFTQCKPQDVQNHYEKRKRIMDMVHASAHKKHLPEFFIRGTKIGK